MNHNEQATPEKTGVLFGILDNPRWRMVVAVVLAIISWVIITVGIQPSTDRTIDNVPVDFTYDAARYSAMDLSIVNEPVKTVSLKVYGNGSDIGSLRKEDFVVYPKYNAVKGPGEVSLSLEVKCISENVDENNIKVNIHPMDTEVKVVFDVVEEKKIPVVIASEKTSVADGYILYRSGAAPNEIIVRGPSSQLEHIDHAQAQVKEMKDMDRTMTVTTPLVFMNADGEPVELNYVKAEAESVDVTLTVYQQAELPLVVKLINTPPGFDKESLRYTLSQSTLQVAGPASVIKNLTELNIGVIDLSTFALDRVYELPVELPNGLVVQENVENVTVNFETGGLTTKVLNLPPESVQVVNLPSSYDLTVLSSSIRNVTLCGPASVLEGITPGQVVARINMDAINVITGQQNIAVTIYVPADNRVFALGTYTVSCQIESQ